MEKPILPFILLFSVLIALTSCNKEQECNGVVPHYANDENKRDAIAPLTGKDTLRFLYNNTDTQVYVGQGLRISSTLRRKASPGECDESFEYLIYEYKELNAPEFTIKVKSYPFGLFNASTNSNIYSELSFKGVNVGQCFIPSNSNDSIIVNGKTYFEPYFWANGFDTSQYFMFVSRNKNPNTLFVKIKFPNHELTLLK